MFKRLKQTIEANIEVPKLRRRLELSQAYAIRLQASLDMAKHALSKKDKRIDKFFKRHPELREEFYDINPSPSRKAKQDGKPTP